MNKLLIALFGLFASFGMAAAQDYYLRGPLFYGPGNDPWSQGHVDAKYKFTPNSDGTLSVRFSPGLNTGNGDADSRNFAISIDDSGTVAWPQSGTIVFGEHWKGNDSHTSTYSDGVPTNEELPVYFGGGRNGVLPPNVTITEIRLSLPTNTTDYADGNGTADYLPNSGAGRVKIITDEDVKTTGRSSYGLETWEFSHTGSNTAAWDVSGGLMWPILSGNDQGFRAKYYELYGGTDYTVFRSVASESLVQADPTGAPLKDYDPDKQIIQYYPGSKVYVIDYKHDLANGKGGLYYPQDAVADGLYVSVPNARAKDDDKSDASYYNVPKILRSGVRFGVYKHTADKDKFKYLKYGRGIRLNSKPAEIGFGSWGYWNGIPLDKVSDPTVENMKNGLYYDQVAYREVSGTYTDSNGDEASYTQPYLNIEIPSDYSVKEINHTFYNAMGDNRLISEYNMFVERIILEVVNEGNYTDTGDHERVYIRFEGRYDLKAVTSDAVTFSYSNAGMENSTNKVGDEPNIYVGNTVRFFDRGFARFYACYDPRYHDETKYADNLGDAQQFLIDMDKYGLKDYTEGYQVESEYSVLDGEGGIVDYIGYENKYGGNLDKDGETSLDLAMNSYPAKFSVAYKSVNYGDKDFSTGNIVGNDENGKNVYSHFMATAINGHECGSYPGRHLTYSANPPEQILNQNQGNDESRYGNATEMIIQGRRLRLLYNYQSLADNTKRPTKVKTETTYYFPNREPNNVPTYTSIYDLKTLENLDAKVNIDAQAEGFANDAGKWLVSKVNVKGSEYAYGSVWNLGTGVTKAYYPVTRWELSAQGTDTNFTAEDKFVLSDAYNNGQIDESNNFKSEDFGRTFYADENGFGPENDKERKLNYTAKMIYTLGNVYGTVDSNRASPQSTVISEKALQQYVNTENSVNNAYALDFNNGAEVVKDGKTLRQFTLKPKDGIAYGKDKDGNTYSPKNINVALQQYAVVGQKEVYFAPTADLVPSGVEGVIVDASSQVPAEYYNLQGVRVISPTPGSVYIVRRGGVVTKELVN